MNFKNLIYAFAIITLFFSCSNNNSDDLQDAPEPEDPIDNPIDNPNSALITYNDDVKSIIDGTCIRCHGTTLTNGAPFSITTFDEAKTNIDIITSRINNASNPMPPTGLMSQSNRDIIAQWQTDGLLEE